MPTARVSEILSGVMDDSGHTGQRLPDLLVASCAAALAVTGVGIVWMTDDGPGGMLAATDGPAATIEELQFTLGEGPCIDATADGRPVLQPDLEATGAARWPEFTRGALEAGARAVFAFPLQLGGIRVGVLDVYRDTPGLLAGDELTEALAFADAATTILLHLQRLADPGEIHQHLAQPLEARAEVHQATGMIAVQMGVTLAEALVLLRAHSYAAERSITKVAADVVTRVLRFEH